MTFAFDTLEIEQKCCLTLASNRFTPAAKRDVCCCCHTYNHFQQNDLSPALSALQSPAVKNYEKHHNYWLLSKKKKNHLVYVNFLEFCSNAPLNTKKVQYLICWLLLLPLPGRPLKFNKRPQLWRKRIN